MSTTLLIHPDVARCGTLKVADSFLSIGLGHLAACVAQAGMNVRCLDAFSVASVSQSADLDGFLRQCGRIIGDEQPDVIGITMTSHTRRQCLDLAHLAKQLDPAATVVLGGPFASCLYEPILTRYHTVVDYVVRGEGEYSFPELLHALGNGNRAPVIPGVSYWDNGRARQTPLSPRIRELDKLPHPDYSRHVGFDRHRGIPTVGMVTSRGCPFNCHFCGSRAFWGEEYTQMSPQRVVSQMEYMQSEYGTELFKFHDDTFTVPRKRALDLFEEIRLRGVRARLYMHTMIDGADETLLEAYRAAGGETIFFGLESGSARMRRLMGKPHRDFERFLAAARTAKDLDLAVGVFVMFGYPGETIEDIRATFRLLDRVGPDDIYISTVKIQPGTKLCENAIASGMHRDSAWFGVDEEYFTCVESRERQELINGCILLLDERYRRRASRSSFEINNEANELRAGGIDTDVLKEKARRTLRLE